MYFYTWKFGSLHKTLVTLESNCAITANKSVANTLQNLKFFRDKQVHESRNNFLKNSYIDFMLNNAKRFVKFDANEGDMISKSYMLLIFFRRLM